MGYALMCVYSGGMIVGSWLAVLNDKMNPPQPPVVIDNRLTIRMDEAFDYSGHVPSSKCAPKKYRLDQKAQ